MRDLKMFQTTLFPVMLQMFESLRQASTDGRILRDINVAYQELRLNIDHLRPQSHARLCVSICPSSYP